MNKKLLLLPLFCSILTAQTVETKNMQSKDYSRHYEKSSNQNTTDDRVISSSAEASAQITIVVTIQGTSAMTSGKHGGTATMSFLDNNRMQITEEMAKGEGEHLETLITMMKLKKNKQSLENIQMHFDELIYLSHNDFLDKLSSLV